MKNILRSHLFLALFLSSTLAHSMDPAWMENGAQSSANSARASDGKFGAALILTDNWEDFLKRWEQPTAGFWTPTVSSIQKGRPLTSAVIFTGCQGDQNGNCSVSADFQVIDPNGKTYADQRGANIWSLPPPPNLQLSVESLGLALDPPDPLGTYAVTATIIDHVANKTLKLRTTFEAK